MFIPILRKYWVEFAAALTVIVVLTSVLTLRPIIGVADNGDFARIMNSTGLSYLSAVPEDRYFGFVNRLYQTSFILPFGGGYLSTQIPLVLLAVYLSKTATGGDLFDIRFLGMLYIVILAVAVFLAVRSIRRHTRLAALFAIPVLLLVFCDIGYTSYFNSLYGEPVTFVFLLLMAGAALSVSAGERWSRWMLVLLCTAAFFFAGAKIQNSPAGLLAALLCIRLAWLQKDRLWRRIGLLLAISVAVVSLACFTGVSKEIRVCNKYQSVFFGVLRGSPDPSGDLEELGLDPSLAVLAGTDYFRSEYPVDIRSAEFKNMLYDKVGYVQIARFYFRHPDRLLKKLEYAAGNGFRLKQGFGNYEKYSGVRYKQTTNLFGFWSDFKLQVLPNTLPFVFLFFMAVFLILAFEYRKAENPRRRFLLEFFGFVAITGAMQFVLPVVADGEADLSKHLFLFNTCFDLLFTAGLAYVVQKAVSLVGYVRSRLFSRKLQTE